MISRRAIVSSIVGVVILVLLYFFATPLAWLLFMAGEEVFPSRISWEGKTAWARCESAIAGRTSWPDAPQAACAAMHLCANEAPLSEAQRKSLYDAIRKTEGCGEP
jgi:hypothetical protein